MKTNFHNKNFALSIAFIIIRFMATQKSRIIFCALCLPRGGGDGGTLVYKLYRYVHYQSEGFLSCFGLKWVQILTILVWKSKYGYEF